MSSLIHANCLSLEAEPSIRPPRNMMLLGSCPGHSVGGHFPADSAWSPKSRMVLEGHTDLEGLTLQRSHKTNVHITCGQVQFFRINNLLSFWPKSNLSIYSLVIWSSTIALNICRYSILTRLFGISEWHGQPSFTNHGLRIVCWAFSNRNFGSYLNISN